MEDWLTHVDTLFNQTTVDVSGKKTKYISFEEVLRKERRSAASREQKEIMVSPWLIGCTLW